MQRPFTAAAAASLSTVFLAAGLLTPDAARACELHNHARAQNAHIHLAASQTPSGEYRLGALVIREPWTRATPKGAPVAAGYLTIVNTGKEADRLTGGSFELARRFEIHEMAMDGGVMRMRQLAQGLDIAAGATVTLRPGGLHLMFMGLTRDVTPGDAIKGSLTFERAGTIDVEFAVAPLGSPRAPYGGGSTQPHAAPPQDHGHHHQGHSPHAHTTDIHSAPANEPARRTRAEGHAHGHAHDHRFDNAAEWSKRFDDPARDAWQKPDELIRALALKPGDVIADIGAGTGYLAVRLARQVPEGRVLAADVSKNMLDFLAERASRDGLANLQTVLGKADTPQLPEKVDVAVLVNTYHHIEDRSAYFARLRASLKPGGRVAIIDYRPESPHGAPRHVRLPAATVDKEMEAAGYRRVASHDFLPRQYFLVFEAGK